MAETEYSEARVRSGLIFLSYLSGNTTMEPMDGGSKDWGTWSNLTTPAHYQPYQIEWSGEVLYRVVTIIIVMFLTIVGNTTLILIITCHPAERRKRVNIFLFNLALGDLMVCVFTMTSEILFVAFGEWVLGAAACKIIVYGQMVTLASAVFLLTAMSIDRYQVLVQPLKSLTGRPRIWKKVATAWALAFTFAIPQLFIFVQTDEGYHVDGNVKHLCKSQGYTAKWQRKVYFTFLTTYILVVPTIIMSFCYINIIRVVWKRTDSKTETGSTKVSFLIKRKSFTSRSTCRESRHGLDTQQSQRIEPGLTATQNRLRLPKKLISSSKRNVVKMTLCVIIGFLICMTPYFVVSLCRIYSDYRLSLGIGLAVAEVMTLVHSALNPILYMIFCTRHAKAALYRMTRCLHPKSTIDHLEDGISDDDTAFADNRRFSVDLRHKRQAGCSNCLTRLHSCLCSCINHSPKVRTDSLPVGFYQELIPNGYAHRRGNRGGRSTETEFSDGDPGDLERTNSAGREAARRAASVPRRQTYSYVVANPAVPTVKDCMTAV